MAIDGYHEEGKRRSHETKSYRSNTSHTLQGGSARLVGFATDKCVRRGLWIHACHDLLLGKRVRPDWTPAKL